MHRVRGMRAASLLPLLLVGCTNATTLGSHAPLTGIRFDVDTAPLPAPASGALGMFAGSVEFAAGRGRLDVTTRRAGPPIAVQGVAITGPLAGTGDYYLFDSTGFVLVRPASRTFSTFALSESSYRLGDVPEPREGFMEFSPLHADTLAAGDSARLTQHGPFTVRWHLDRRQAVGPARVLARGWIEVVDAPAGEASAIRWFGASAVLARMAGNLGGLSPDSLRITAAIVLPSRGGAPGSPRAPVTLIVLHALRDVAIARVDPARLVVPAGFVERPWPGFEGASNIPGPAGGAAERWRTMPRALRK
jgi:hypothetical protein